LQLQDGSESHYLGTSAAYQLSAAFMAADLLRVKSAADLVAMLAQTHRGWKPYAIYGESCHRYLLGDLDAALSSVLAGLEIARPGREMAWGLIAAQHVRVLRELGQLEQALAHSQAYLATAREQELTLAQRFLCSESARTLAAIGCHADALALLDPLLERVEASGASGLALGTHYETRAWVAIAMRDRAAFEHYAGLCAREYKKGNNPAIFAKLAQLFEHARQQDLAVSDPDVEAALSLQPQAQGEEGEDTIVGRLLECVDAADRARCALMMLLQSSDALVGYLFGVSERGLVLLAGVPDSNADPELEAWLGRWLQAERSLATQAANASTASVSVDPANSDLRSQTVRTADETANAPAEYVDRERRRFHAVMLLNTHEAERKIAAVLVLPSAARARRPPAALSSRIAGQLLVQNDVSGLPL
jgi:hypothetical protein